MLEIPESTTLARQLNETVRGKTIKAAAANTSAHKFAFYHGDPGDYHKLLTGQTVGNSTGLGAMLEIAAGDRRIVLGDGAAPRFCKTLGVTPAKHQLLIEFEEGGALVVTVHMYGAVLAFIDGEYDNPYYLVYRAKPHPLSGAFDQAYFNTLRTAAAEKLSAKAFLATEQRIPGLGNGVLQDILFTAHIHPKRKIATLSDGEYDSLYHSLKEALNEMTRLGGRDTEKDLFGNIGGYTTKLSRNTVGKPCPVCGTEIQKTAYMGGTVYWCPECQRE
jgi:formamidopyrimidine-DNA glycosylase